MHSAATCAVDWQPVIAAIAALIVATTPGVAAFVVALGNRSRLNSIPLKRATDGAVDLTAIRSELRAVIQALDSGKGGGGGGGGGVI